MIGASAGGVQALQRLLSALPAKLAVPVLVVIHRMKNVRSNLADVLQTKSRLLVKEAEDKELLKPGTVYIAPANYHMLVERDKHIALSVSEPVNFSRPSIDVTFFSVAESFGSQSIGIILTGANTDGSKGLGMIEYSGGLTLVQDPEEAQVAVMPEAALQATYKAQKLAISDIAMKIKQLIK